MEKLEKDIAEIKTALLGNEFNKNGLLQRVETIEKYQAKDKKAKWTVAGGLTVIMFLYNWLK